ncbi:MAG: TlpA family protein disulfide reductase [Candidatus Wallbacteria bacterium]|nr:TlpA family protein disulfide reductase [Candidatus Wallbacteria bacterium]
MIAHQIFSRGLQATLLGLLLAITAPAQDAGSGSTRQSPPEAAPPTGGSIYVPVPESVPAPVLQVQQWVAGSPLTLEQLKGKVVLLDMFQIICPGCHAAHPHIVKMQQRYGREGLQVIGLAVAFEHQASQTPDRIQAYVKRNQFNFPVAIDRKLTATFESYGARGTPYVALLDRQGRLRHLDFYRPEVVEGIVEDLLKESE